MTGYTWDTIKNEGGNILDKLKELLREGNVRRVVVEREGRTIAEFPLSVGVVGAVFAPVLAAVGALVALVQDCDIRVERAAATPEEPDHTDAPVVTTGDVI
jgi:hypothetical protein